MSSGSDRRLMGEGRISAQQREAVVERARGHCEYCRSPLRVSMQPFAVDHIVPRSRRGTTDLDNLALACNGCNAHKYNKIEGWDEATGYTAPLFHPRRDRWRDHFTWAEDFTVVLGITATGRASVETLHLNRVGVVNLRRLLRAAGEHPPAEPEEDP